MADTQGAASTTSGAAERQPFTPPPNWGAGTWKPGESGNRSGVNRYLKAIREAVQKQESPERVCAVVAAMHDAALGGDARAAKVYLETVGVPKAEPPALDLKDASDEFVAELLERTQGAS